MVRNILSTVYALAIKQRLDDEDMNELAPLMSANAPPQQPSDQDISA